MRVRYLAPVLLLTAATAQQPPRHSHPATQVTPTTSLPITRVALYKNGVGFFEHSGRVAGDQAVTIDFTSAQLNDVLQSLTAIDLNGGRITGAGYNSTTPLEQQLKTLPLGLSDDPSDVDFYNAIRGARVSVSGPGAAITGRLLSIDLRPDVKKSDANSDALASQAARRFLTVVSDSGQVRTIELTQGVSVTLVDTALHTDVTRYLELISNARNQGLRHLTLTDRGTGNRDLRVSYISEVPVWKSTYRILFTDAKAANDRHPAGLVRRRQHHRLRLGQRPPGPHRRCPTVLHPAPQHALLHPPPRSPTPRPKPRWSPRLSSPVTQTSRSMTRFTRLGPK